MYRRLIRKRLKTVSIILPHVELVETNVPSDVFESHAKKLFRERGYRDVDEKSPKPTHLQQADAQLSTRSTIMPVQVVSAILAGMSTWPKIQCLYREKITREFNGKKFP